MAVAGGAGGETVPGGGQVRRRRVLPPGRTTRRRRRVRPRRHAAPLPERVPVLRARRLRGRRRGAALLLLLAPVLWLLRRAAASESAAVRVLVFAATAGARVSDVESAARAVLPRFYADDVHPAAWRVFATCGGGRRLVVTATPRVMAEPFLRDYLGADTVAGTELAAWRGRATGMVDARRGVLVGEEGGGGEGDGRRRRDAGHWAGRPEVRLRLHEPMQGGVPRAAGSRGGRARGQAAEAGHLPRRSPRLASEIARALAVAWFPVGFLLAMRRDRREALLPMPWLAAAFEGSSVCVVLLGAGAAPRRCRRNAAGGGVLFASNHRTLLGAVFLSVASAARGDHHLLGLPPLRAPLANPRRVALRPSASGRPTIRGHARRRRPRHLPRG
ncbi:hypothetical protein EE612_015528, partial [Oryza sativa]